VFPRTPSSASAVSQSAPRHPRYRTEAMRTSENSSSSRHLGENRQVLVYFFSLCGAYNTI
jgi:hypothetical protein